MVHQVNKICDPGAEVELVWGLKREAWLRSNVAPGLGGYLSKLYPVGDATVEVEITPGYSWVRAKKAVGGYTCLPHSELHPQGKKRDSTGAAVTPEAVVTMKYSPGPPAENRIKVKEQKKIRVGTNDWRGKVGGKDAILTYSAHNKRYRLFEGTPSPQPGLWRDGKEISTEVFRRGVKRQMPVLGAGMAQSPNGVPMLVMFTPDWSNNDYKTGVVYYRPAAGGDWWVAGEFVLGDEHKLIGDLSTGFTDPVYFSPDGKNFVTVIRAPWLPNRGRKLVATIAFTDMPDGKVVASASIVVDQEEPSTDVFEYEADPPLSFPIEPVTIQSGVAVTDIYTETNHIHNEFGWAIQVGVSSQNGTRSVSSNSVQSFVVAFDYDRSGAMKALRARVTERTLDNYAVSGAVADPGAIAVIDTEPRISTVTYGEYTPSVTESGGIPENAAAIALAFVESTTNATATSDYTVRHEIELFVDGAALASLVGNETSGRSTARTGYSVATGPTLDSESTNSYCTRFFTLNHVDIRDLSYVIGAMEAKWAEADHDPVMAHRFYALIQHPPLPPTVTGPQYSPPPLPDRSTVEFEAFDSRWIVRRANPIPGNLLHGTFAVGAVYGSGAYASRREYEYLLSASSRNIWLDLREAFNPPQGRPTPQNLTLSATSATKTTTPEMKKLFTDGMNQGFAINPISIF